MMDLTPLRPAPPLPNSTPGGLQCAMCLYGYLSQDPQVVTIMDGHAVCRPHMTYFDKPLQEMLRSRS